MMIDGIEAISPDKNFIGVVAKTTSEQSFGDVINDAIDKLNNLSNRSATMSKQFAAGENVELHDVMVASQEADVAMRLTLQLRNKVMEAYREVMRMGV